MALSSLADARFGLLAAVFLAAWLPWNYIDLRDYRHQKLADDAESRDYVAQLHASAASFKGIPAFLYHGMPPSFPPWGVAGVLRYLLPDVNVKMYPMELPRRKCCCESPAAADAGLGGGDRKLWIAVHDPQTPDTAYIMMNELTPVWQLTNGWFGIEEGFRWTAPDATARLYRAAQATQFEVVLNVGRNGSRRWDIRDFSARLNGVPLGTARLTEPGIRTVRWPLPPGPPGTVEAEFQADPPCRAADRDPRTLGAAIVSFGFLPSGR